MNLKTKSNNPYVSLKAEPKKEAPSLDKLSKENIICGIVILGFAISVIYHYLVAHILGHNFYPYNSFLSSQTDQFSDYFNQYKASKDLNPYILTTTVFSPFSIVFFHLFTFLRPWNSLLIIICSFVCFFTIYIYTNIRGRDKLVRTIITFILTFMSYPLLCCIDSGSSEIWLFISLVFFVFFFLKGAGYYSVLFLAIAISFNFYAVVFVILYLMDKKYIHFIAAVAGSLIINFLSAALLKGGAVAGYKGWVLNFTNHCQINKTGGLNYLQHNVSLYALLRSLFGDNLILGKFYCILVIVLLAVLVFFLLRKRLSTWKTLTLIVFSYIILPQVSFDYKLINIFILIMLFLNSRETSKFDMIYAILFGILIIPKNYIIFSEEFSISAPLNTITIVSFTILFFYEALARNNDNHVVISEVS